VTGRIFVAWEQEGPDPRDQHLAIEGFDRQRRQGNFSDTVRSLGVGYPDGNIHKVHLVLPHGCELLVHPESRLRDDLNDIRVLRPDDSVIWLEANGRAFFDGQGRMLRIIGIVADVTERKLAEEALAGVSRRLIEAQEQERARIARELHDDIGQRLAL
jgi:signal transduction histidine kinase